MARRPARRRAAVPAVLRPCVHKECRNEASEYALSAWYCPKHDPKGDPACTHSLGGDRCSYCGSPISQVDA
jgi:hypothetical protein